MNKEQVTNINGLIALNTSTSSSAGEDLPGNIIDTRGSEALTFLVQSGTITAGNFTVSLEHGDTATLSDAENVGKEDLIIENGSTGDNINDSDITFAATDDNEIIIVGYRGAKRYVRLNAVSDNAGNGTVSATAFRGYLSHSPA